MARLAFVVSLLIAVREASCDGGANTRDIKIDNENDAVIYGTDDDKRTLATSADPQTRLFSNDANVNSAGLTGLLVGGGIGFLGATLLNENNKNKNRCKRDTGDMARIFGLFGKDDDYHCPPDYNHKQPHYKPPPYRPPPHHSSYHHPPPKPHYDSYKPPVHYDSYKPPPPHYDGYKPPPRPHYDNYRPPPPPPPKPHYDTYEPSPVYHSSKPDFYKPSSTYDRPSSSYRPSHGSSSYRPSSSSSYRPSSSSSYRPSSSSSYRPPSSSYRPSSSSSYRPPYRDDYRNFDSQDGINFHPRSGVRSAKPDNEDVKDEGESDKTSQKSDRVVFRDN